MQKKPGFTFLELLLTLSLITILSLTAIPTWQTFTQHTQATLMQEQLLRAIQFTRTAAIFQRSRVMLCGSRNQKTCDAEWSAGFIALAEKDVLYHWQTLTTAGTLFWRAFPLHHPTLDFLPTGLPNAENGTFWFCLTHSKRIAWAISLNQVGRVRLLQPNAQGEILDERKNPLPC